MMWGESSGHCSVSASKLMCLKTPVDIAVDI